MSAEIGRRKRTMARFNMTNWMKGAAAALAIAVLAPAFAPAQTITDERFRSRPREERRTQAEEPPPPTPAAENKNAQQNNNPQAQRGGGRDRNEDDGQGQRGGAPRQQREPSLGEFNLNIDRESRLMRLNPQGKGDRQDLTVIVGDEFTTDVNFSNKDLIGFDGVRILLSYESDFLEPLAINDSPLAYALAGEPTAEVDPLYGQILYEAKLNRLVTLNDAPLLSIRWKAKRVNTDTQIEFSQRDQVASALVKGDEDLLGNPKDPLDGTLDMTVIILPEDPREREALLSDPRTFDPRQEKIGNVRMMLRPPDQPIVVGEPFAVDLILDNRAFSLLDGVGAYIQYDPQVLEILDADWNNWITLGNNIHDGPFRDNFPWNFQIDNTVLGERGAISYRMGTDDAEMTRGKVGTIARIYAVATEPAAATKMTFRFSEKPRDRATEARYMGEDVLGSVDIYNDGAQGVVLSIRPTPMMGLAGAGE